MDDQATPVCPTCDQRHVAETLADCFRYLHERIDALGQRRATKGERRRLEDLRRDNRATEANLKAQGAQLTQDAMVTMQTQALKAVVLEMGGEAAEVRYGIAYQEIVAKAFEQVGSDLARAKLTQGTPAGNGKVLHLPKPPGG